MRIGIDIGGTKIAAGLVSEDGTVLVRKRLETAGEYEGVKDQLLFLMDGILQESSTKKEDIGRVGIASAGQVHRETGEIIFSPNLRWRHVPLREDMERVWGATVRVENDVNAATFGEWRFGLGGVPESAVGVFVGTGVGGGLILDRKLHRGHSSVGGEVGHMTVNPFGYRCHCGNIGCLEAYCGGSYVAARVRRHLEAGYRGRLWDIVEGNKDALNMGHVEQAALAGDELCTLLWDEVALYLGCGLASLANLLNPEVMILGGGVIRGTRGLVDDAEKVMRQRAMAASVEGLKVVTASRGDDAAILGAAFVED
jgi:glucokinase